MNKRLVIIVLIGFCTFANVQSSLIENFKNPPIEAKPWTFWYWMHGAVSKVGIRADLKAMHEIGLGGAYLMPIRGVEASKYPTPVNQLTPEWWDMVRYSFQIADSLGLKMGMHISDGFALAGGPWITPAESMQKLVFTDTIVNGGKHKSIRIKQPEAIQNYYQDIAIYAVALTNVAQNDNVPCIKSDNPDDPTPFTLVGKDFRSNNACYIQYSYNKPFLLRSIEIIPAGNNIQSQRLKILASNDGITFRIVKQLTPPRQGWQNTGFNTTFSVQPTEAKFFRLAWSPEGSEPGSEELDAAKWKPTLKIKSIKINSEARINGWEGKSGLVWRIAEPTAADEIEASNCIAVNNVINLTPFFRNGQLTCKLPKGNWRILRMGHTSTGMTNATGGGGKGLECDKFSEVAVQKQFDNWFAVAFSKTDPSIARRVLKYMHIDSWECGSQNWSRNFPHEFQVRRGYDLIPYLPLLAGFPIESVEKSEQILRDVRITIAELVNDVFFKVMVKNAKAYGCEISAECIAPTFVSDGLKHFGEVDRPMGEFWLNSPTHDKPNDMLDAISGAHIYGKKIIQAEGFTQLRTNWNEDPAMLKPLLDRNFALGINKLFFHVFVHNPYVDKAPGTTLDGIGLYFQRDQTWWKQAKAFVDYITRCQMLLQYGKPVVDIAVFTGEEIPSRAFTPDKLVTLLPSVVGEERIVSERNRLANIGQPMHEMPVGVNHSANIFKADNWINPLNGYAYDSFNKDVLLQAKVMNAKMVFPGGAEYSAVIFPDTTKLSTEVSRKIEQLKKAGVYIPEIPLRTKLQTEPDVILPPNIAWTHRAGENTDIYFISNQQASSITFEASFRHSKGKPQLFNPVNAKISSPSTYHLTNGRLHVTLNLAPYESVFVVFGDLSTENLENVQQSPRRINFKQKWTIQFLNNNQLVETDALFDWSTSENPLIKYYSGTAVYKSSFIWNKKNANACIDLGKVNNMATVRINGIECGTAWTAPYVVDITNALSNGTNLLEIEVVNTWANAINGWDKGLPPFEGIWTDGKYRIKDNKLVESGLIGPISILYK